MLRTSLRSVVLVLVLLGASSLDAAEGVRANLLAAGFAWQSEELRRFPAAEATQGVVADAEFLYVIGNHSIGKYRKGSGERVGGWQEKKNGPLKHLNAGIIHEGRLYCAHSNYPTLPSTSSVEIFDPVNMTHIGSHSFGIAPGSLTWIARHEGGHWYACFAHYAKDLSVTGKSQAWTEVVRFDDQWRRTAGWVFPPPVVEWFGASSCSGGVFAADGDLYITGHDAKEMKVLRLPPSGSVLELVGTVTIAAEGQAFGFDPMDANLFYGIIKRAKEVVVCRISRR